MPRSWGRGPIPATITTSGSSFAADNKSSRSPCDVTNQPIAAVRRIVVRVRLAQGAPAYSAAITLTNAGQGTLEYTDAKTSGAAWITALAYSVGGLYPGRRGSHDRSQRLAPGSIEDAVTITSNAVAYAGAHER